jgi:hypothetical protein
MSRVPFLCRLGFHRMRYAGVSLDRRVERCERCGLRRLVLLARA